MIDPELQNIANEITNETRIGANTAQKIGALFSSLVEKILPVDDIAQQVGTSTTKVMSQVAVRTFVYAIRDAILKGSGFNLDSIQFNPATETLLTNIGQLRWNAGNQTLEIKCSNDVTLSIGQENYIRGKNAEITQILNGKVVYVSGGQGANALIKRASNNNTTGERVIGVATQNIGPNSIGFVTTNGIVNEINTSAFAEGDVLWLGVDGALTNVKPGTDVNQICIGVVLRSHATQGSLLVSVKDDWRGQVAQLRSDLNETITALEQEQIQVGIITKDIPFHIGAIATSGETDDDANWIKTDYISTPVGRKFLLNLTRGSGVRTINLYDSSKNIIAYDSRNFNNEEWANNDSNVCYVRFSGKSASYGSYTPIVEIVNYDIKDYLQETNSQTQENTEEINEIKDYIQMDDVSSIVQSCQDVIVFCARAMNLGEKVLIPDGNGSYGSFWIRDYAMQLDGNANILATDILTAYNLIKSKITTEGDKAYWVPDHINYGGTPVWRAGSYEEDEGYGYRASLDGAGFLVRIAYKYVELTNDISFINSNIDFLAGCINSLLSNSYKVNAPSGQESVAFGFYDTVKLNGDLAYPTIQCYESFKILEKWADIAGLSKNYPTELIKEAFNSTFVRLVTKQVTNGAGITITVNDYGFVKPATGLSNGQFDVWSTAYAIRCGILSGEYAYLCAKGLSTFYNEYMKYGQAKHCPDSFYYSPTQMWESYFYKIPLGTYQNGGYWLTPIYDLYFALQKIDKSLANELRSNALKAARQYDFPEYVSKSGVKAKTYYGSSAAYVYKIA